MSVIVDLTKTGFQLIALERARQISEESFGADHDNEHKGCELAMAACCYAAPYPIYIQGKLTKGAGVIFHDPWPWEPEWDKRVIANNGLPNDLRIKDLIKAGALIAAEIDRLIRVEKKGED